MKYFGLHLFSVFLLFSIGAANAGPFVNSNHTYYKGSIEECISAATKAFKESGLYPDVFPGVAVMSQTSEHTIGLRCEAKPVAFIFVAGERAGATTLMRTVLKAFQKVLPDDK